MRQLIALTILIFSSCSHVNIPEKHEQNSAWAMQQPYVILVSIDGYRFDYTKLFHPPALSRFVEAGVSSESLIPIYPSKTFASHYSMITGLTADHSGIVANDFYDPSRKEFFSAARNANKFDGSWYLGHPLWELASHKNMLSASYFWVGSDAPINHVQPTYWLAYNDRIPNEKRVEQILNWLELPAESRPHFLTLYFSDVDTAGHRTGAATEAVGKEVLKVDQAFSQLIDGVNKLRTQGLLINIIVVSDHGMDNVNPEPEFIDYEADLSKFIVSAHGPELRLYLKENEDPKWILETQKKLRSQAKHYKIYRRNEVPLALHYRDSARIGDLIVVVDEPYLVETHTIFRRTSLGNHGWDARQNEKMRGIFYAEGPAFRHALKIPAFENFNIYSVVTHILSLDELSSVDSTLKPTSQIFAQ